jgi:SAM-dependent methyltransferase
MRNQGGWLAVQACNICGSSALAHAMKRGVDGATLDRCGVCGVVFLNPRPPEDWVRSWYDEAYFSGASAVSMGTGYIAQVEAGVRHGTEPFRQLSRKLRLTDLRLLEVGCGGGAFLLQCRDAGADVTGLDVSEYAAQRLAERYHVRTAVGTIESLDPPTSPYDIVAFVDVLEHVTSPKAFMEGIRRVLSDSGHLFGVLPNLDSVAHYGRQWAGLERHPEHLYYPHGQPRSVRRPSAWKGTLRRLRPLTHFVRWARCGIGRLSRAERERQTRYRAGLGHDLFFLAVKSRERRP